MRENTLPQRLFPVLTLLLISAVYLKTMAPDIFLSDSGELIGASYLKGIPHPSGSPLYALLGGIFSRLPLGNIAWRINLLSLFGAVAALYLTFYLLRLIFPSHLFLSYSGLFFLSGQPHFWQKAVTAEVYSWQLFLTGLILLILFEQRIRFPKAFILPLVFGLASSLHPTTVFLAPAILVFWFAKNGKYRLKHLIIFLAAVILGLSLYIYLPLRAVKNPSVNWGNPDNLQRFIFHTLDLKDRQVLYAGQFTRFSRHLKTFFNMLTAQYFLPGLLMVLIGFLSWFRGRAFFWFFILAVSPFIIFYCLGQRQVHANNFVVVFFLLLFCWVKGLKYSEAWLAENLSLKKRYFQITISVLLLISFTWGLSAKNLRRFYLAPDYINNILVSLPPDAAFITSGDTVNFGLVYFIHVMNRRADLRVTGSEHFAGLPGRGWSAIYYIGRTEKEKKELNRGLVKFMRGEPPTRRELVWKYFTTRNMDIDVNLWSDEIKAGYPLARGAFYLQENDPQRAVVFFDEASGWGERNSYVSAVLGWRYTQLDLPERAERQYSRFIRLEPDNQAGYLELGNTCLRLGRLEQALANYKKALRITPDSESIQNSVHYVERLISN